MLARSNVALLRRSASTSLIRRTAQPFSRTINAGNATAAAAAALHSSSVRKAASHEAGAAHGAEEEEHYPSEGFGPFWRYTFFVLVGGAAYARYSTSQQSHSSHAAEEGEEDDEDDSSKPFLTRYLAYNMPKSSEWIANNEKHIDAVRQGAEDRIFFQDAQRPPIHRLRFPSTFETGSPGHLAVGDQVDVSDVEVKNA